MISSKKKYETNRSSVKKESLVLFKKKKKNSNVLKVKYTTLKCIFFLSFNLVHNLLNPHCKITLETIIINKT